MKNLTLSLLILLIAGACSKKPATLQSQLPTRLDSLFQAQILPGGPGATALVMMGDSVVFSKSYGVADIQTQVPIDANTLFNLGSISKTFVANGILMLRDEGKLSLEDSLIKYFPSFKNKEIARKVKIKHLLTHTSGLPDNRNVSADTVFYLTANDAQNWEPVTQADRLDFEPGSKYEYSNPAYNGLALIIEQVSGQKWQNFIAERIFKPAGMSTSTITDGPHPASGVSHSYVQVHGQWTEDDFGEEPTFCAAGNGGVWSSINELVSYHKSMEAASFSNARTIAESRETKAFDAWTSPDAPFIGWSWFIGKTGDGHKTVFHTGTQGGFYCDFVTVPDKKVLYVLLANYPINRDQMAAEVLDLLEDSKWLGSK